MHIDPSKDFPILLVHIRKVAHARSACVRLYLLNLFLISLLPFILFSACKQKQIAARKEGKMSNVEFFFV